MPNVHLPRPIEAYFAHAELPGATDGRRFTITLPYFDGPRLDRIQWWWTVSNAQQRIGGEEAIARLRREATARFRQHIEHWLVNNERILHGDEPIPRLRALRAAPPGEPDVTAPTAAHPPAGLRVASAG